MRRSTFIIALKWTRAQALNVLKLLLLFCLCLAVAEVAWVFQNWLAGSGGTRLGDYFDEADWGILQVAHGHLLSLYATPPAPRTVPLMMPLSLIVRAIALAVGAGAHIISLRSHVHVFGFDGSDVARSIAGDRARYQLGAIAVMAFGVAAVIVALYHRGCSRDRITGVVVGLALLAVPLTGAALFWGHPEEFLMGALIAASLLACSRSRWGLAAFFFGLAVATKEPAWLLIPTLPFLLPTGQRRRGIIIAAFTAAVVSLPFLLPHLSTVIGEQTGQVGASAVITNPGLEVSIWGLFQPLGLAHLANYGRDIIIIIALALPLGVASKNQWKLSVTQAGAIMVLVLLARSFFDPFDINYYEYPAVAALLALEVHVWRISIHPLQARRYLARLRPIPVVGLLAGVLLWGANRGFIFQWLGSLRVSTVTYPLMYVLVNIIIAAPLLLVLRGKRLSLDRVRVRVYGGLVIAALALFVVLSITNNGNSKDHLQVAPPPGMIAASPNAIAQKLASPAYWFGPASLPGGRYLRTSAYASTGNKQAPALAFFDYGDSSTSFTDVAVYTIRGTVPTNLQHEISLCAHPNMKCRKDDNYVMRTIYGPALVTTSSIKAGAGVQWQIRFPKNGQTIVVLSSARLPIAATMQRLRVLSASNISQSSTP